MAPTDKKPYVAISPSEPKVGQAASLTGGNFPEKTQDFVLVIKNPDGTEALNMASHTQGGSFSAPIAFTPTQAGVHESYLFLDRSAGDGKGSYNYNHATVDFDFSVTA